MTLKEQRIRRAVGVQAGEDRIEQGQVGAGSDLQVQVRAGRGRRRARVDNRNCRPLGLAPTDPRPQDRVTGRCVRAEDQHVVGSVDVRVRRRRAVAPEGAGVSGDRRGHAQPRVRVDVVGGEESLRELVGDVVVLGEQLARDVERNRVWPVLASDPLERPGEITGDLAPAALPPALLAPLAPKRHGRAVGGGQRLGQRERLAAGRAAVDRVQRIAFDLQDPSARDGRDQTAACAAVRAARADLARALVLTEHAQAVNRR